MRVIVIGGFLVSLFMSILIISSNIYFHELFSFYIFHIVLFSSYSDDISETGKIKWEYVKRDDTERKWMKILYTNTMASNII